MRVLLFGATGMVGQGVLRECFLDPDVRQVVSVVRAVTEAQSPKLREIVHHNFHDFSEIAQYIFGVDACFFCLGVSSAGISEEEYTQTTFKITLAAAELLSHINPGMVFIYVSGEGTDSSERGPVMWARVKGSTENALLQLRLKAYMFRPGLIQPLDGIRSKTPAYRLFYTITKPVLPLLRRMLPNYVLSTRDVGQAMLSVAKRGYSERILEVKDIRNVLKSDTGPRSTMAAAQ